MQRTLLSKRTALAAAFLVAISATVYARDFNTQGWLVDGAGMTLYTFEKDSPGLSVCVEGCARTWPPHAGTGTFPSADWSAVRRTDGIRQWAFRGMPVYRFEGDAAPGDKKGDGAAGLWSIVRQESAGSRVGHSNGY